MSIILENQSSLLHFHRRKTDTLNSGDGTVAFAHQRIEEKRDQKTGKDKNERKTEDNKDQETKDKPGSEDDKKSKDKDDGDEKDKKPMSPQKKAMAYCHRYHRRFDYCCRGRLLLVLCATVRNDGRRFY